MKKIFAFLILLVFLVQIVYANGKQKEETKEFDTGDSDTWEKTEDWSQITSQQLVTADSSVVERATVNQAETYFMDKIPPTRELNSNEWVLIRKIKPNLDQSLSDTEGIKVGDKELETPNGVIHNYGNSKSIKYTKDGLDIGDNIVLTKGDVTVDSDGYPIFEDGSSYKFTSPNGILVNGEVEQRTKHGSCTGVTSCIEERQLQIGDDKGNKKTVTELFIRAGEGIPDKENKIHLSMKDGAYDAVAVERNQDSLVSINFKKIDGNLASIDFMQEGAISQRSAGLQTDFYRVDPDNELLFGYGGGSLVVDPTATGEGFEEDPDYQDERFNLNLLVYLALGRIAKEGLHEAGHYAYGEEHGLEPGFVISPEGVEAAGSLLRPIAVTFGRGADPDVLAGFDIAGMAASKNVFKTINEKTKTGELNSRFMDALAISSALDFPSYALLGSRGGDKLSDINNYALHTGTDKKIIYALAALDLAINSADIFYHTARLLGMNPPATENKKATIFGFEVEPEVVVDPNYGMGFMVSGSKKW